MSKSVSSPPSSPASVPARSRRIGLISSRAAIVTALTAGVLLTAAGTAFAHVTVDPGTAAQGGDAKIAFRTPNEEDSANTVKLEVSFPTGHPIPSVLVEPIPGWTAAVDKVNLAAPIKTDDGEVTQAVSKITWSGGQVAPGQFQDFDVSLEGLPSDTDSLVFKTVQTYSNGDVVRWIDTAPAGGPEPEHPAPTLTLTKAGDSDTATASPTPGSGGSGSTAAVTLGILGAVLGLIGAVLGGLALRRRAGSS